MKGYWQTRCYINVRCAVSPRFECASFRIKFNHRDPDVCVSFVPTQNKIGYGYDEPIRACPLSPPVPLIRLNPIHEHLKKLEPFPWSEWTYWVSDYCLGVCEAHWKGLYHHKARIPRYPVDTVEGHVFFAFSSFYLSIRFVLMAHHLRYYELSFGATLSDDFDFLVVLVSVKGHKYEINLCTKITL